MINICDCTIRDGGYYTNWDFEPVLIEKYLKAVEKIPNIKIVELGYRNLPQSGYYGEYFYCPKYFLEKAKKLAPSKELAIMLNEKACTVDDLDYLLNPCVDIISLVRLAVNPDNFERALILAVEIKKRGFKVAFNLMYLSNWSGDDNFIKKLSKANGIVDYLYLVDSFGGIAPDELSQAIDKASKNTEVPLGFHGHNNIEFALANSVTAIDKGCKIVDSTFTGMGRGAGNLKTELLLSYLNAKGLIQINLSDISDVVTAFETMQQEYKWGTSLPYMISGAYSLPQADVMSWMSKKRYSVSDIVNRMQSDIDIKTEKEKNGSTFQPKKNNLDTLIIGGGPSAVSSREALIHFIEKNELNVIFAGVKNLFHCNSINNPLICLSGIEYLKLESLNIDLGGYPEFSFITAPNKSNQTTYFPAKSDSNYFHLNEIEFTNEYLDSLLTIALQTANDLSSGKVFMIGFDGYSSNSSMKEVEQENQSIISSFIAQKKNDLVFLNTTSYKNVEVNSIYSYI